MRDRITREQARWIANGHIRRNPAPRLGIVERVLSIDEINQEPGLYGVSPEDLLQSWIVYCQGTEGLICNSMIILVSKTSGAVLYAGSANDEG